MRRYLILSMAIASGFGCAVVAERPSLSGRDYFPASDDAGGWRSVERKEEVLRVAGMDKEKLEEAFRLAEAVSKNGGLLVVRNGWLVFERYFGKGHREAIPNLASLGKSFTSIAVGILMEERPDLFPEGLDQEVFKPPYFPEDAFPLSDPGKAGIKLGQLLTFSAGIRGNNPVYVNGQAQQIEPAGPDGWRATLDEVALGKEDALDQGRVVSTRTLWTAPGGGYSYATSSIHLASMMLRHISGMELQEYLRLRLAVPLEWGRWGWGYKYATDLKHTPGGAGTAVRPTDMLRFGYLLLREGYWNGRPIVPAAYVRHAGAESPYNPHYPYSLQFNVNSSGIHPNLPRDTYWKTGSGGHVLYIVPSLDLVVWKPGGRDSQYSTEDTGLSQHPEAVMHADERPGFEPAMDFYDAFPQILELIIAAIEE